MMKYCIVFLENCIKFVMIDWIYIFIELILEKLHQLSDDWGTFNSISRNSLSFTDLLILQFVEAKNSLYSLTWILLWNCFVESDFDSLSLCKLADKAFGAGKCPLLKAKLTKDRDRSQSDSDRERERKSTTAVFEIFAIAVAASFRLWARLSESFVWLCLQIRLRKAHEKNVRGERGFLIASESIKSSLKPRLE